MNKTIQYRAWGNILQIGFRYAQQRYPLSDCLYASGDTWSEEYRWFYAGYDSYTRLQKAGLVATLPA